MELLNRIYRLNKIRAIDFYFSEFINQKNPNDKVALAAALVSNKNTTGAVCIALKQWSDKTLFRDETFEGVKTPSFKDWVATLKKHPWVSEKVFPSPLVLDGDKLYLGKYWNYEQLLANNILKKLQLIPNVDDIILKTSMAKYFPISNKPNNKQVDWQAFAAYQALHNNFSVISGGPGTGKTTTVLKILALLLGQNINTNIVLCAPTGKAAARLSESIKKAIHIVDSAIQEKIPSQAFTIHRLLKNNPQTGAFKHNKQHPLILDVLVIDEASMVDLSLMAQLFEAIPNATKVILLGDKDQLSSVEAGSIFDDITGRGTSISYSEDVFKKQGFDTPEGFINKQNKGSTISQSITVLQKSYRFTQNSGIGQVAYLINNQKGEEAFNNVLSSQQYPDCDWLAVSKNQSQKQVIELACNLYQPYLKKSNITDALNAFEHIRVLCAVQEGYCGVSQLNSQIKDELVKRALIKDQEYYQGMPIMVTKNDYESELFNGDTGLLWKDDSGLLSAYFPQQAGLKKVNLAKLPEFVPAFALTIHKSQGSEFNQVVLVLPDYPSKVLNKALLYTGITRAKKHLTVIAEEEIFIKACNTTVHRESGLADKLGW